MVKKNIKNNGMINLLFIGLLIPSTIHTTFGQSEKSFTKGNILSGGSFAISLGSIKDFKPGISPLPDVIYSSKSKVLESNLSFGYFLVNQFAVGLKNEILLSRETTRSSLTSETEWDITKKDFLIGPVIRFYTKPGIFAEGYAGIRFLKSISNDDVIKWIKYSWR